MLDGRALAPAQWEGRISVDRRVTDMPILDGLDIPALEWCSIAQAIQWIEGRDAPLNEFHESLLPDHAEPISDRSIESGRKRLVLQAATGGVSFRGRPSKGKVEILFDESQKPNHAKCAAWGKVEAIPPGKVEEAGLAGLEDEKSELICSDPLSASQWAYAEVEVNFKQLMKLYPAPAGEKLRVGGEPVPVGRTDPVTIGELHPVPIANAPRPLALPPPSATA